MSRKQDKGTGSKFLKIIMLVPTLLSLVRHTFAMMHAEVAEMRKKLIIIAILAFFLFILTMTTWLCVNAFIYFYLISLNLKITAALAIIMAFNFLLFIICCLIIALLKVDPTFPETRKAIKDVVVK